MLLCDIGNTNYKFLIDDKIKIIPVDSSFDFDSDDIIYFISVNKKAQKKLQKSFKTKNLKKYINIKSNYCNRLGDDRKMLIYGFQNKIIADFGSAITIDVVKNNIHLGGYIFPGISKLKTLYPKISKRLDFKFSLNSFDIPRCTDEAISASIFEIVSNTIKKLQKKYNLDVVITGGDGKKIAKILDLEYKKDLIFTNMKKIINPN